MIEGGRTDMLPVAQEQVDEADADTPERAQIGEVLQPRDRRLARQPTVTFRCPVAGDLQRRVVAQSIKIVGVLVATGDGHRVGGDHVGIRVRHEQRVARVRERLGNHLSDAEAARRWT